MAVRCDLIDFGDHVLAGDELNSRGHRPRNEAITFSLTLEASN
jgi:hypothetical protein